jgi:hypothetical protein
MRGTLIALAGVMLVSTAASAQQATKMSIGANAGYDLSLRCYQFYDVEGQVAAARAARAAAGTPEAEELGRRIVAIKAAKDAWNLNIDKTKGARKAGEIDADLGKVGAPIIADANASLGGDAVAKGRMEALNAECKAQESAAAG